MTASTEQDRAEVICTDQGINVVKDDVLIAFIPLEQAARRAQVVPQGVQVQDTETKIGELLALARIMVGAAIDASSKAEMTEIKAAIESEVEFERTLRNTLAAAPRPPEAAVKDSLTAEVEPVQMPEAFGWIDDGGLVYWRLGNPPTDDTNIYTEHQVRQLLASHGIK